MLMEIMEYKGWPNCVRLSNRRVEVIVTTDVGPRIIRFGFNKGQNFFKEYSDDVGKTGGKTFKHYGGHRLWHAPEINPRSYCPDNEPIKYEWNERTLKLTQPLEEMTGIIKEIEITIFPKNPHVAVLHRLINKNVWDVELSPWCLSVMAQGGKAIIPQEPLRNDSDALLPVRPLALWSYTNMNDSRWIWGKKFIQLKQDSKATSAQKVGVMNSLGWAAYYLNEELFVKRFGFDSKAKYPDFGCNTELYTNADMLEVESLGPLTQLAANGGFVEHREHWFLFKTELGESECEIEETIQPLINKIESLLILNFMQNL